MLAQLLAITGEPSSALAEAQLAECEWSLELALHMRLSPATALRSSSASSASQGSWAAGGLPPQGSPLPPPKPQVGKPSRTIAFVTKV